MASRKPTGWKCPKCGREFVRKSAYHGCGQYTVEGYLEGKRPEALELYKVLIETARSLGDIVESPAKTQICLRARTTFLMVALSGKQLVGYLFLDREAPAQFFRKVTAASARRFVHHFRIADAQTITGPFASLLGEAIAKAGGNVTVKKADDRQLSIGEEINAIYRAERLGKESNTRAAAAS